MTEDAVSYHGDGDVPEPLAAWGAAVGAFLNGLNSALPNGSDVSLYWSTNRGAFPDYITTGAVKPRHSWRGYKALGPTGQQGCNIPQNYDMFAVWKPNRKPLVCDSASKPNASCWPWQKSLALA